jgi:hypothetical protein
VPNLVRRLVKESKQRRSKRIRLTKNPNHTSFTLTIRSRDDESVEYWGCFSIKDVQEFLKDEIDYIELKRID